MKLTDQRPDAREVTGLRAAFDRLTSAGDGARAHGQGHASQSVGLARDGHRLVGAQRRFDAPKTGLGIGAEGFEDLGDHGRILDGFSQGSEIAERRAHVPFPRLATGQA